MGWDKKIGFNPVLREGLVEMSKAMAGDLVITATPATVRGTPSTGSWTRSVVLHVKTASGDYHNWLNSAISSAISIADTASASTATASVSSTTVTFVDGRAVITVSGSAGTWASGDTDTLSFRPTICGKTLATVTSVETFRTTA